MTVAVDQLNRPLRNLSISLTDRYNFRCVYYMPKEMFGRPPTSAIGGHFDGR